MGYKESVCPEVPSKKPGGGFSVWMFLTSMALTTTIAANIANSANSNNNNNNDNNNEDNQNTNNYNVSTTDLIWLIYNFHFVNIYSNFSKLYHFQM